ncbi:MAG: hypothetical protein ACLRZ9_05705 [Eubacterium sp.]
MTRYIYTEKAEKRAKELGLEERKAGTVAMFGGHPLQDGPIAMVWEKHGFVVEANFKKLGELHKGKFTIMTDRGNIESYYDSDLPIFLMVPNDYKIYGFIQD